MSIVKEFKEFAVKGNVVDMGVGIVIGAAFTSIVTSFVGDIMTPIIGVLTGGVNFADMFINLSGGEYKTLAAAKEAGAATINYGKFINACISFLIVALTLFAVIRTMNKMKKEEEAAPSEPPAPPREQVLLEEIRDLLAKDRG
ncbi:MAG: large conductance mechanosensitive channel protein MscL [Neomegalonema sp.]|nr:large conductance mechanosensitive channel protein MscL [Neomegalonema sp.]